MPEILPLLIHLHAATPLHRAGMVDLLRAIGAQDEGVGVETAVSGPVILRGRDELGLDRAIDALKARGLQFEVGAPRIAYLETITRRAEVDYTHKWEGDGSGEFARVKLLFDPGKPGSGFVFRSQIVGGAVPTEFVPGVERGLEAARSEGLIAGYLVDDLSAVLLDGSFHDVDSSLSSFEVAAHAAFMELASQGDPTLLEPIMKVEVAAPEERLGAVLGDSNGRGWTLEVQVYGDEGVELLFYAPLSGLFGYRNVLKAITGGEGRCFQAFSHYEPVDAPFDDDPNFPQAMAMRA